MPPPEKKVWKVLVVDDHEFVRKGILSVLEADTSLKVIGEAADIQTAQDFIIHNDLDLVLLDVALKGQHGLELLKRIKSIKPELPVVILSMFERQLYAHRMLAAGAAAYLEKTDPPKRLIQTIHNVLNGIMEPALPENTKLRTAISGINLKVLSDREMEIFHLMGEGWSKHQLAENLKISLRTVETHRDTIRKKLDFSDNHEMEVYAVRYVSLESLS